MNISISNIALKDYPLTDILPKLKSRGITGLDIAPGLVWPNPSASTRTQRKDFHDLVHSHGLEIVGMHALLFNYPRLTLFESKEQRQQCLDHLKSMVELCADMEGRVLVLGAAKNRTRGALAEQEAFAIARAFFSSMALTAQEHGVMFCIEPLAEIYGCDFIRTVQEAAQLVQAVDHPHFRLMVDTGSLFLNNEPPVPTLEKFLALTEHMHINDPELYPPGARKFDHQEIANTLRKKSYTKWVAMEFLRKSQELEEDIRYAQECYGEKS